MKQFLVLIVLLLAVGSTNAQQQLPPPVNPQDTVYNIVDVLPSYPGGDEGWKKYLKKNLKYPKKAWWDELETDVVVEFVVRKDGSITDVAYLTVFGYGFEEEAVRLIKNCGKWNPGMKGGKAVHYHAKLTIPFRMRTSKE